MSINIRFPLEDDVNNNRFFSLTSTTKDAVSSDLMLLLLTEKGYRYYMPDYGTYLIKYIFEPNDNITIKDVETDLKQTVEKYLPEIKVVSMKHTQGENETEQIIDVVYTFSGNIFTGAQQLQITF
jgi:phage baseplate assembly protein W